MAVVNIYMSIDEACQYLVKHAKDKKTSQQWFGYLKHNSRLFMKQDGYRIVSHVIDGNLCYTEASLKAFIKILDSAANRAAVNQILNTVDTNPKAKPKNKKVKAKKPKYWRAK